VGGKIPFELSRFGSGVQLRKVHTSGGAGCTGSIFGVPFLDTTKVPCERKGGKHFFGYFLAEKSCDKQGCRLFLIEIQVVATLSCVDIFEP